MRLFSSLLSLHVFFTHLVFWGSFFQVEPNTKLFPAVFASPSSQNMLQFELGKLKVFTFPVKFLYTLSIHMLIFLSFLLESSFSVTPLILCL